VIPFEEARAYVLNRCPAPVAGVVDLRGALGLVLSEPVCALEAVPPFDNTAMDGFAVRAADTTGAPVALSIVGTLAAGSVPDTEVGAGEAMRIMTGAPIPPGADAVVMVERTSVTDDDTVVTVEVEVPVGNHVRGTGEDLRPGQKVFVAGTVLGPAHIGVLASIGCRSVAVYRRLRVGVLSTGDELVTGTPGPGQIRDSNRDALLALLEDSGVTGVDLGLVADDEHEIEQAIVAGAVDCDAVLTSGGVSMGDFDYVKAVLDRIGDMRWMQVAIRPAKPLVFGLVEDTPVFGLPGNPVSSMVSFELFARPALLSMFGHVMVERPRVMAVSDGGLGRRPDGKVHFARVAVAYTDGRYRVRSAGGQGSHQLSAMASADGLAVIPDGDGVIDGGEVEVLLLR
jgi:molybdenum cofactor synthesis domain-containing protein|tara:strand:+ start:26461 stop:27654 length:1194 start_codon:yes stop_codon:yes gene_type:complete